MLTRLQIKGFKNLLDVDTSEQKMTLAAAILIPSQGTDEFGQDAEASTT